MIQQVIKVVLLIMLTPFILIALYGAAWISAAFFVMGVNLFFKSVGIDIYEKKAKNTPDLKCRYLGKESHEHH